MRQLYGSFTKIETIDKVDAKHWFIDTFTIKKSITEMIVNLASVTIFTASSKGNCQRYTDKKSYPDGFLLK